MSADSQVLAGSRGKAAGQRAPAAALAGFRGKARELPEPVAAVRSVLKWLPGCRDRRGRLWLPPRYPVFRCCRYRTIRLTSPPRAGRAEGPTARAHSRASAGLELSSHFRPSRFGSPFLRHWSRLRIRSCKRLRNSGWPRRGSPVRSSQRRRRGNHLRTTTIYCGKLLPIRSGLPDMLDLRRHGSLVRFAQCNLLGRKRPCVDAAASAVIADARMLLAAGTE